MLSRLIAVGITAGTLLAGLPLQAQDQPDATTTLRQAIESDSHPVAIDTILVVTNLTRDPAKVSLHATDDQGRPAGVLEREVPGNGLSLVLASEFRAAAAQRRFIGQVEARARGRVTATALLVGGPLTDLPASSTYRRVRNLSVDPPQIVTVTQMSFPVVAAY
jgi:hypothetical protein